MARAALELGVRELAEAAKVSTNTITRFERGEPLKERTVDAVKAALEAAGVEFIPENGSGPGVRLKKKAQTSAQLAEKIADLHETLPVVDEKAKPSPQKAMKQLERAHGKNEIAKAKNKRTRLAAKSAKPKS